MRNDCGTSFVQHPAAPEVQSAGGVGRPIIGLLKSYLTMMSLHINNQFVKKRGIGKNLFVTVRAVMLQDRWK